MSKLKKIDAQTNVITWFEIPVSDITRAKKFYETIFLATTIIDLVTPVFLGLPTFAETKTGK